MLALKKRSLLIVLRNAVGWNAAVWKNQWTSKIFLAGEVHGCRSPEVVETVNAGRRKISGPAKYFMAGEVLGCRPPEMVETVNAERRKISGPAKYLWLEKCS